MNSKSRIALIAAGLITFAVCSVVAARILRAQAGGAALTLQSKGLALRMDGLFYETASGRIFLPSFTPEANISTVPWMKEIAMPDGHAIRVAVTPQYGRFTIAFSSRPNADIIRWGFAVETESNEYLTGLMERVVDGAQ